MTLYFNTKVFQAILSVIVNGNIKVKQLLKELYHQQQHIKNFKKVLTPLLQNRIDHIIGKFQHVTHRKKIL